MGPEETVKFGSADGLNVQLTWQAPEDESAEERTMGQLRLAIGDKAVWSGASGRDVTWNWSDLLGYLAYNWFWLTEQEGLPFGETGFTPDVVYKTDALVAALPEESRERHEDVWWDFAQCHDLSVAIQGMYLPPVWIVRHGHLVEVFSGKTYAMLPAEATFATLAALCDCIAARMAVVNPLHPIVVKWRTRARPAPLAYAGVVTYLPPAYLHGMDATEAQVLSLLDLTEDCRVTEAVAVARMAGPCVAPTTLRRILEELQRVPLLNTRKLDEDAQAVPSLEDLGETPYVQGYALAQWFRVRVGLGLAPIRSVRAIVRAWNVRVREVDLGTGDLQAIASWGPRHGPGVVLNTAHRRHARSAGQRFTLAHEACHLLLDRNAALPLAEVMGGAVLDGIEERANAFAAEFLLPRQAAADAVAAHASIQDAVSDLSREFVVGKEVVAWQIHNSSVASALDFEVRVYLRGLVHDPRRRRLMTFA